MRRAVQARGVKIHRGFSLTSANDSRVNFSFFLRIVREKRTTKNRVSRGLEMSVCMYVCVCVYLSIAERITTLLLSFEKRRVAQGASRAACLYLFIFTYLFIFNPETRGKK